MNFFTRRRLRNGLLTLGCLAVVAWELRRRELALLPTARMTGWLLWGNVAFLTLFWVRKKLPVLPLGNAAAWMQAHLYAGLAAGVLFWWHVPWRWPNGVLETALAALFAATFANGVLGLYWTRTLPRRLAAVGEEVIFERVPLLRSQIREQASAAVLTLVESAGETTLAEFYRDRLQGFFEHPPRRRDRWFPSTRNRKVLLAELTETTRYLSDRERAAAEALFALIRRRDQIDYHEALQWRLKAWLMVHWSLVGPLLLTATMHGWLASLFSGQIASLTATGSP